MASWPRASSRRTGSRVRRQGSIKHGYDGPTVPAWTKRMPPPDSDTPARSKLAIDRLIARWDVHLREKTLWRMLYETCARAEEILDVNIEELDLAGRRAPVKTKGAPARRRGGRAREDFALETVYWDAGTARLIKGRTRGPVFVTHRRPGPGKVLAPRDVCPDTGLARLSYGQARALLDEHTAMHGPGTGWDLHEYRHSGLSRLGEQGASLLMLMAKSRHKKPENVRRYFKPTPEAIAEVTSLLAPGGSRQ
ncbi:Phage integrase family protein [Streptomyces sp. Ncost-T10-10d]|nr:Phage integrase family protein [Streptomyces sp. Ncost-T10-10d]